MKKKILEYLQNKQSRITKARNSMGCSENWYSPLYSITETFTKEEIEKMSEQELQNLYKLADNISDGLY